MRTHGQREGSTTHWGLLGGIWEGQQGGELGRDSKEYEQGSNGGEQEKVCI